MNELGLQRGLGDALQHRRARGRLAAFGERLGVVRVEFELVDLLADQEVGVAAVDDLDLLQHLTHDHLDVLVVDLHALQPIDLLDLVDEIVGQLLDALNARMSCGTGLPSIRESPFPTIVAFLQIDVLALRDQVLDRLAAFFGGTMRCGAWTCSPCRTAPGRRSRR